MKRERILSLFTAFAMTAALMMPCGMVASADTGEMPMVSEDVLSQMLERTIDPSKDIVAVKGSYSEIKDVATKNFVLKFKAVSNTTVFRHDVWFGTKQGVVPSALDGTTYTGRTNYLGKLWEDVSWLTGYFEGDSGLNEPTVRAHGIQRQKFGVAEWWKRGDICDVYISFIDNVMVHGIKKADEDTYTWYSLPYSGTAKVGGIGFVRAGGEVISYSDMTLWTDVPTKMSADKTTIAAADTDEITLEFSEAIGDYPSSVSFVCGEDTGSGAVAQVDDTTFTVSTPGGLKPLSEYSADLTAFKSARTSLECMDTLNVMTDPGDLPQSVYTVSSKDEFDGTSNLMWERTESNIETGYSQGNGTLMQTAENAEIRMRKYLVNEYYAEFKANVTDKISFAMCNESGEMKNQVEFVPSDDTFSAGENTFCMVADGEYIYSYVSDGSGYKFLGKSEADLEADARPVIASSGIGTTIDYIDVRIKADADTSAADEKNQIIEAENEEIRKRERALAAVNDAESVSDMVTALSSSDLNMYSDEYFAGMGENTTIKDAYAEIILNYRNGLENNLFKSLDEFEKYAALSMQLCKLSNLKGDSLAAVIDQVNYDGIVNSDEDYTSARAEIAKAFENVRGEKNVKAFKTYDEVKGVFITAKALGVLNAAETRDDIPNVLEKYSDDLGLNLSSYEKSNKSLVNTALLKKDFESASAVQKAIDDKIKSLSGSGNSSSTGSTSGGSSSSPKYGGAIVSGSMSNTTNTNVKPSEQKKNFSDLDKTEWARESVETLAAKGIVDGVSEGKFEPMRNVTRAEFVKLIVSAFGMTNKKQVSFSDVASDTWYADSVSIAASNGIVNGISDTEFAPGLEITRQDAALIIYKCMKDLTTAVDGAEPTDMSQVADYAASAVKALYQSGIINGDDGYFAPANKLTRAEAACMLHRALKSQNLI